MIHIPVLLKEVVEYLSPKNDENFIDCTLGAGGHSLMILEKISPNGRLLSIDLSSEAIKNAESKINLNNVILVNDNFSNLKKIVEEKKFYPVNGILLDLGLSSDLLEKSGRGFSFQRDEFLDMRFGEKGPTAYELISQLSHLELEKIFREYGEEKFAEKIAYGITRSRRQQKIKTTQDLVGVINQSIPQNFSKKGKIKIYARIFQALRIAVNDELNNLEKVLRDGVEILSIDGRIVVITFHSLEDRIVKNFFRQKKIEKKLKILTKKPTSPSAEELKFNPRSRPAKLRAAVKISRHGGTPLRRW